MLVRKKLFGFTTPGSPGGGGLFALFKCSQPRPLPAPDILQNVGCRDYKCWTSKIKCLARKYKLLLAKK